MLGAVLGDLQTEVGGVYNTLLYAFDFVSEYIRQFGAAGGATPFSRLTSFGPTVRCAHGPPSYGAEGGTGC